MRGWRQRIIAARVHGSASPGEFLAALNRAVPAPHAQLKVGAKVDAQHSYKSATTSQHAAYTVPHPRALPCLHCRSERGGLDAT